MDVTPSDQDIMLRRQNLQEILQSQWPFGTVTAPPRDVTKLTRFSFSLYGKTETYEKHEKEITVQPNLNVQR